ncbi:MAG TPA: glycosyltransferase [Bacteroidia bacterium]|nr:glycosyltransferase [Bacteroidia bacterium]
MRGISSDETVVIITSDEPWGDVMHTQLHYAFQLSKHFDVIYINPPRIWNPARGVIDYKKTYRVNSKLLVIPYRHVFPVRVFRKLFTFFNDIMTSLSIRKFIPAGKSDIILWRFDHFRFFTAWLPGSIRSIYHVVDQYAGKPGDNVFASASDLVVVTSPRLTSHYEKLNKNVITVPQCIPEEDNITDPVVVNEIREQFGQYLLFIGTFSHEVDIDLLNKIARRFPDNKLLIIGPVVNLNHNGLEQLKAFQSNANVCFFGSISGLELKNFIRGAAVCLVPYKFKNSRAVHIRSPLKILNYISQKRPVVTSMESELPDPVNMGVYFVESVEEFIEKIDNCLHSNQAIDKIKVDTYLEQVDYSKRINQILDILENSTTTKHPVK